MEMVHQDCFQSIVNNLHSVYNNVLSWVTSWNNHDWQPINFYHDAIAGHC